MSFAFCMNTFRARVWRIGDRGVEVGHFEDFDDLEDWQLGGAESTTATSSRSAEAEAIDHMPASAVKDALQSIPEDFRMAVYLADVEGFAYQEIADIMHMGLSATKMRYKRALDRLRDKFSDTSET